jgi:hypothetical protein
MTGANLFNPPPAGRSWRDRIKIHPAADLFPMMSDEELIVLGEDIKKNGLRQPIIFWREETLPKDIGGLRQFVDEKIEGLLPLLDGRNRLAAIEAVGLLNEDYLKRILAAARTCHAEDAVAYVISANIHRRHLSAEDKERVVAALLKANPKRSDRETAKLAKVSHPKVAKVRSKLEQAGDVETVSTRTDTKGRHQPATKAPRAPSKEAQTGAIPERTPTYRADAGITGAGRLNLVDELARVSSVLKGDLGRINEIPLAKRIALARGCMMALGLSLDDLRPLQPAPSPIKNGSDETALREIAADNRVALRASPEPPLAATPTATSVTCCLPAGCRGYPGCKEGGRCLAARRKPSDDDLAAAAKDTKAALAMLGGAG